MKRRQLLAGCGALLAGAGTGCVGLFDSTSGRTDDATPEPNPSDPDATPVPPTPRGPTATPTATPHSTSVPTPDPTPSTAPGPTPVPDDVATARREALTAYRAGYRGLDAYDRDTEVARIGFERAKYGGAAARYRDAVDEAAQSATYFDWAAGWAALGDRPGAREAAESAVAYTRRVLREFASRGVAASEAANAGRLDEARDHVTAMRSAVARGRSPELSLVALPEFEERIGF
jgi:hypothetical protein